MEYEALVMVRDNPGDDGYKEGDIVVVRPKGWQWGRKEVKGFLIVPLGELTETEAAELESDIAVEDNNSNGVTTVEDAMDNAPVKCIIIRRRHKFDLPSFLNREELKALRNKNIYFQPLKDTHVRPVPTAKDKMKDTKVLAKLQGRKLWQPQL